jgi:hypothetical protein
MRRHASRRIGGRTPSTIHIDVLLDKGNPAAGLTGDGYADTQGSGVVDFRCRDLQRWVWV